MTFYNFIETERNKLASKIKREVVKVRRQLALQKGEKLLSDDEINRSAIDETASEGEGGGDKGVTTGGESSPERAMVSEQRNF